MNSQIHTTAVLSPGKEPPYLLSRRFGGHHSRPGRCGEEENLLPVPIIEPRFLSRQFYSPESILQAGNFFFLLRSSCVSVSLSAVINSELLIVYS
jgi:hypothetical protein